MERGDPADDLRELATPPPTETLRRLPRSATAVITGQPGDYINTIAMRPNTKFGLHSHSVAQLVWPESGAMRVDCGTQSWILSTGSAVWIPSQTPHDVLALAAGCRFRSLYLSERCESDDQHAHVHWLPPDWQPIGTPTSIPLEPLLLVIIDALDGAHPPDRPERARLESVMFDRLRRCLESPSWPTGRAPLPLPVDDRARRVACALLERLHDNRDLAAWGLAVGSSARTLRRLWPNQTGLTFHQWRGAARMQRALELMQEGEPVNIAARTVGYVSPGAFSDAFTAYFGVRPSECRAHA